SSSTPTVETAYPRAHKGSPVKFRSFPHHRASAIALFPFRNPITEAAGCWGRIAMHMCTRSGIKCPSRIWSSFCRASERGKSPPDDDVFARTSLCALAWGHTQHDIYSPTSSGIGLAKGQTLHPPGKDSHHATLRRMLCRNRQTPSSLTGRTSGLPKTELLKTEHLRAYCCFAVMVSTRIRLYPAPLLFRRNGWGRCTTWLMTKSEARSAVPVSWSWKNRNCGESCFCLWSYSPRPWPR